MAILHWVGATAGNTALWNDPNSFSFTKGGVGGDGVPGPSDDVDFDDGGGFIGGCIVDAPINVQSMTLNSGYSGAGANDGHFDNSAAHSVSISGNLTCGPDLMTLGAATWTIGGSYNYVAAGGLDASGSTIVMTGTGNILAKSSEDLNNLTIDGTITNNISQVVVLGTLTVNGTLNTTSGVNSGILLEQSSSDLIVNTGGVIGGTAPLRVENGISVMDGTINTTGGLTFRTRSAPVSIPSGDYDTDVEFVTFESASVTVTTGSGTFDIGGDLTIDVRHSGRTLTIQNGTNNPDWNVSGSVDWTPLLGIVDWQAGSGTFTLDGTSGTQTIDFNDQVIEDLDIDHSGTLKQFSSGVSCVSFVMTSGTVDLNGQTIVCPLGNVTVGPTAQFSGDQQGALLDAWDVISLTGESGDLLVINNLDFNIRAATAISTTASFCDVIDSTGPVAGGGMDALDGTSVDGGGNSNWLFGEEESSSSSSVTSSSSSSSSSVTSSSSSSSSSLTSSSSSSSTSTGIASYPVGARVTPLNT